MNFSSVINKALKNETVKKEAPVRYYSTKFEPPKKEQRKKDQLSVNVKKFLQKREEEEKKRQIEAQKRKEELLALRSKDKKAVKRVNVMLKRTKSANQSVIQDAVDSDNTAVTLAGPSQPDEDDYGYVSQEASAFYNKMMEKYSKLPPEENIFDKSKSKKVNKDLNNTKDRVRAALEKEKEEALLPHKRKRKSKTSEPSENVREEKEEVIEEPKFKKPKVIKGPPPMNFSDLLKLAEKKQYEPIVIEKKPKEEEAPLTKKQKMELERIKEYQERKQKAVDSVSKNELLSSVPKKLNGDKLRDRLVNGPSKSEINTKVSVKSESTKVEIKENSNKELSKIKKVNDKIVDRKPLKVEANPQKPIQKPILPRKGEVPMTTKTNLNKPPLVKERANPVKQFPPPDVRRPKSVKMQVKKGRILDDDEEYDSEMDDFIDDGPEEDNNYSKYISEIFGYNKSRYADEDDDVDNMETSFAQQMKEEVISTKIGIMEDLEDIKQEEEHKKRKLMLKKKGKYY